MTNHPELEAMMQAVPLAGNSMRKRWLPGDEVEYVYRAGAYAPEQTRPAHVVAVEDYLLRHERLVIRYDDTGEERAINPDVMRHRR